MENQHRSEPGRRGTVPESWCVILPVRRFSDAKSRLGAELPDQPELRAELARSFALDVLSTLARCPSVDRTVIVGEAGPDLVRLLGRSGEPGQTDHVAAISAPPGLNPAVEHGERWARMRDHRRIAVIAADLPCLAVIDVETVLAAASLAARGFVVDEGRAGTTMLTTSGPRLRPSFGANSAQQHLASGAVPLPATAAARLDVDQLDALLRAQLLGVGGATAEVLARNTIEPPRAPGVGRLDRR